MGKQGLLAEGNLRVLDFSADVVSCIREYGREGAEVEWGGSF